MLVEFYEGAIDDNQLYAAVEVEHCPRQSEFVELKIDQKVERFEIISVEHVFETQMVDTGICYTYETTVSGLRCGMMKLPDRIKSKDTASPFPPPKSMI
jgi:hypothetical protein